MIFLCTACMLLFFICNPVVWWTYRLQHNVIFCNVLTMKNVISFYYYLNCLFICQYEMGLIGSTLTIDTYEFLICNPVVSWSCQLLHNVISCHVLTWTIPYCVNAILNYVTLFVSKKCDELSALILICAKPVICLLVYLSEWGGYKCQTSAVSSACSAACAAAPEHG